MKFNLITGFPFGLHFPLGTVQVGMKMYTALLSIVINKSFLNPS